MAELDKACCSLPAVTTHDYKSKGSYTEIAGLKTCEQITLALRASPIAKPHHPLDVTGSTSTTRGIIAVYDIFGEMPQTLQGADRIAESVGALVLMPDFFKGKPLPLSLYPPDTDEKKKTAMSFMATTANIDENLVKLAEVVKEAKGKGEYESVKNWGIYGLCWGGKVCWLQYL